MEAAISKISIRKSILYFASVLALLLLVPELGWSQLVIDGGSTFTISPGDSITYDTEFIGDTGTGTLNQTGGSNTITTGLYLGRLSSGSSGTYTLSGSGSLSALNEYVGIEGNGTFNQTGGTHTVGNLLSVGVFVGGPSTSGIYNLSGGSLSTDFLEMSYRGFFNQDGGTFTMNQLPTNGRFFNYNLSGSGILNVVGEARVESFTQSGGTHTDGALSIWGYYNLSGGTHSGGTLNFNFTTSVYNKTGGILDFLTINQTVGNGIFNELTLGLNTGDLRAYNLSGGSLSATNEVIGHSGSGTFTQSGGTQTVGTLILGENGGSSGTFTQGGGSSIVGNLYLGRNSGSSGIYSQSGGSQTVGTLILGENGGSSGAYNLSSNGSLSAQNEFIGLTGSAAFTQTGGTHSVASNLFVGFTENSSGTYNLEGGTLSAGSIWVNPGGTFNVSGGTQTATGNVTNTGMVKTTNTDVTWNGTFTNNGVYVSDPSTQTFSDLSVGTGGYLVAGAGDVFRVSGNFDNQSTQNTDWDTAAATLQFTGTGPTAHNLSIPGTDYGPTTAGYTDNFSWDTLILDPDQTLTLVDGSDSDGGALYLEIITGLLISGGTSISNIDGAAEELNIYYNPFLAGNDYLGGLTYAFDTGSGQLIPTPLPASALLLGSGLLGLGLLGRRRKRG